MNALISLTAPAFVVIEEVPVYHPVFDGVCGSSRRIVAAGSEAFALASARRREHSMHSEGCDEVSYWVASAAEPFRRWNGGAPVVAAPAFDDDMPF